MSEWPTNEHTKLGMDAVTIFDTVEMLSNRTCVLSVATTVVSVALPFYECRMEMVWVVVHC